MGNPPSAEHLKGIWGPFPKGEVAMGFGVWGLGFGFKGLRVFKIWAL